MPDPCRMDRSLFPALHDAALVKPQTSIQTRLHISSKRNSLRAFGLPINRQYTAQTVHNVRGRLQKPV